MTPFTIAVLAIALERLLVVASALISIILGWSLFARAVIPDQSGSISIGDWKVELKRVGPGVFFSLFGAIILVYAFLKPAQYSSQITAAGQPTFQALGVGEANDNTSRSYVRALNTIAQIQVQVAAQPPAVPATLLPSQRTDLAAATNLLTLLRREILVAKLGAAPIDEWEKYGEAYQNAKQRLPADVRNRLSNIAPWFIETVTDEKDAK